MDLRKALLKGQAATLIEPDAPRSARQRPANDPFGPCEPGDDDGGSAGEGEAGSRSGSGDLPDVIPPSATSAPDFMAMLNEAPGGLGRISTPRAGVAVKEVGRDVAPGGGIPACECAGRDGFARRAEAEWPLLACPPSPSGPGGPGTRDAGLLQDRRPP